VEEAHVRCPARVDDAAAYRLANCAGAAVADSARSTAVMAYDFEHSGYSAPIGLGIGQVIPREKVVYNLFIEPQVSLADKRAGWPKWQVFVGLNAQFK
jgi:hypothetical protein